MSESTKQLKTRLRRRFDRAAPIYDQHAGLQREITARLLERLDFIRLQPAHVLDLGAGTGEGHAQLQTRYPEAQIISADFSHAMLKQAQQKRQVRTAIVADAFELPLKEDSMDLVFSSSTLQWCEPLEQVLEEIARILQPDGVLMFSSYGPDTLYELRAAQITAGIDHGVNTFRDMHPIGDLLLAQGYRDPVLDTERLKVDYPSVKHLMQDLQGIGSSRLEPGTPNISRQQWEALIQAYSVEEDGHIQASYEVIYGYSSAASIAIPGESEGSVKPLVRWT